METFSCSDNTNLNPRSASSSLVRRESVPEDLFSFYLYFSFALWLPQPSPTDTQAPLEQLRTYNPKSAREDGRLKALGGFWRRSEVDRVRRVTCECYSSSTDIPKATTVRFVRGVGQWLRSVASVLADSDFFYPSSGKDLDDSVIEDACRSSLLACVRGVFWRRCVKPTRLMEAAGSSMVRWWLGEKALFLWLSGKARDLLTGSRSQHVARSRILERGQPETRGLGGCPNLQDYNALVPDYLESPTVEYAPSVEVAVVTH
ncbi:hypothetical protein F2Q69_00035444 [Brassica cretica]|uniref:Uncharacterized protein n=1 Tax=Brassica cretica TaxID=69181 RepID=A0A8S9SLM6_BRACR|nr:hypothetical protein F2Q69_00035444 [Brassica cretica]